jgi:hypothetical protein
MDHEVNTERQFLIAGGVWLVTPMLADARAGLFGAPITLPIELLGNPLCDPRQLSRDKVEKFKTRPDVLTRPVLLCQHDDGAICQSSMVGIGSRHSKRQAARTSMRGPCRSRRLGTTDCQTS